MASLNERWCIPANALEYPIPEVCNGCIPRGSDPRAPSPISERSVGVSNNLGEKCGCALCASPDHIGTCGWFGKCADLCATGPQVLAERGRNEEAHVFLRK